MAILIKAACGLCDGSGEYTKMKDGEIDEIVECPQCGGSGKITISGFSLKNIEDKLDDILDKCNDIFEKVNE